MKNTNLRNTLFGGYNKKDVLNCLEKIQAECDDLKKQTENKVQTVKNEYEELDNKYKQLLLENENLKKECNEFHDNKNLLIQLEIDANTRAKEKMELAEQKAIEMERKAQLDADTLRQQHINKVKEEMLEIKNVHAKIMELYSCINDKNKKVQEEMNGFDKIIGEKDAIHK